MLTSYFVSLRQKRPLLSELGLNSIPPAPRGTPGGAAELNSSVAGAMLCSFSSANEKARWDGVS